MAKIFVFFFLFSVEKLAYARGGVGEILIIGFGGFIILMWIGAVVYFFKKNNVEAKDWAKSAAILTLVFFGAAGFIWSLGTKYGLWVIAFILLTSIFLNKKGS